MLADDNRLGAVCHRKQMTDEKYVSPIARQRGQAPLSVKQTKNFLSFPKMKNTEKHQLKIPRIWDWSAVEFLFYIRNVFNIIPTQKLINRM